MELPTREELSELLKNHRISKRLVRDIRYVPEEIAYSEERDFLAVFTKSGSEGVLIFEGTLVPIERAKRLPNKSGRIEAVICDICATWQRGTNSAVLTLRRSGERSSSYLVCADLDCSLHVRDLTDASKISRTQLREHNTISDRIARLNARLRSISAQ